MTEKTLFMPFLLSDYAYLEKYLDEKAQEGLLLKSLGLFSGKYYQCAPCKRRHCVIPIASFDLDSEENIFYEDFGWHKIPATGSWVILYTENIDAPDLFTDKSSFISHSKWYTRGILLVCALNIALLLSMLNTLKSMGVTFKNNPFNLVVTYFDGYPFAVAALLFLAIGLLLVVLKDIRHLPRYNKLPKDYSGAGTVFVYNMATFSILVVSVLLMILQDF